LTHRKHAHMHTRPSGSINLELVDNLESTLVTEPLGEPQDPLYGPKTLTLDDLDAQKAATSIFYPELVGADVEVEHRYHLERVNNILKGIALVSQEEGLMSLRSRDGRASTFDLKTLLREAGVKH